MWCRWCRSASKRPGVAPVPPHAGAKRDRQTPPAQQLPSRSAMPGSPLAPATVDLRSAAGCGRLLPRGGPTGQTSKHPNRQSLVRAPDRAAPPPEPGIFDPRSCPAGAAARTRGNAGNAPIRQPLPLHVASGATPAQCRLPQQPGARGICCMRVCTISRGSPSCHMRCTAALRHRSPNRAKAEAAALPAA